MFDAFLIALNVAAFVGYGTIPLDVFFPQRSLLASWLPPGEGELEASLCGIENYFLVPRDRCPRARFCCLCEDVFFCLVSRVTQRVP